MPTALDTDMRTAAKELIDEFGASVSVYAPFGDTYSAETGQYTGPSDTGVDVLASPPLPVTEDMLEGMPGVVLTDKVFYLDALNLETAGIEPEIEGTILHDGTRRQIAYREVLWSGEQIAAYKVVVKF